MNIYLSCWFLFKALPCVSLFLVFLAHFKVEIEALVLEGPKLTTVLSQVKKLEAAVLVLGQKKPSALSWYESCRAYKSA